MRRPAVAAALIALAALPLSAQHGPATEPEPRIEEPTPPPETMCVSCHVNLAGALSAPVNEWTGSIHWASGVGCDSCHGGDPQSEELAHSFTHGFIGRPPRRDVPYFCGQCHAAFTEKHLAGPHGQNGIPTCIYCHGNHDVQQASPDIISRASCTRCHAFDVPERFRNVILEAENLLQRSQEGMAALEEMEYNSHFLQQRLGEAHGDRVQIHLAVHSFNVGEVTGLVTELDEVTELITDHVTYLDEAAGLRILNHQLHIIGYIALILFALGLHLLRHLCFHHHRWTERLPPDWEIPKKT